MLGETTRCANSTPPLTIQPMEAVIMAHTDISCSGKETKTCASCGQTKPFSQFYFDKRYGKPIAHCKTCRLVQTRDYVQRNPEKARLAQSNARKKKPNQYRDKCKKWLINNPEKAADMRRRANRKKMLKSLNITAEDLEAAFQRQDRACAICKTALRLDGGRKSHIDHCHKTQKFRGVLCVTCNTGLGKFGDDPLALERAAMYLRGQVIRV